MLRSVVDEDGLTVTRRPTAVEVSLVSSNGRTRAVLVDELVAGTSAPDALIACVRALVRHRNFEEARSLTRAARRIVRLREAAHAAAAVIAVADGRFQKAEDRLRGLSRESALRLVPPELVAVEFAKHHPTAVATTASILSTSAELAPETWLDLARHTFARGEPGLSEQALSRVGARQASVPRDVDMEARWLEGWIARARADRKPGPAAEGHVAVAVLDYKLPDYRQASDNPGDYIQTVASLGHLVRHQDLRFHGDVALVAQLSALQARVQPDQRLRGVKRDVTVVAVNRDASSLDAVPEGTWMLAFGWYMHRWFKVRYDFPFHPHLRPLFISFHINRPKALSEEGVTYLRKHAPIGCRDWDTVRRLLGLGIPAFFSGCLTSTVDLLFPADPPRPAVDAPVALVDVPSGTEPPHAYRSTRLRHSSIGVREAALPANIERAVRLLEAYRRDFSGVVTSRLHCYLPTRALGVDARFQSKHERDTRFEGLVGIDDASFAAMQEGIRAKLEVVLSSILRGDDEQTVRASWRDLCAPDVEAARRRHPTPG
ncbi:MAG: hypothetical protein AABM42_07440 [Actinomycetota bacterium]